MMNKFVKIFLFLLMLNSVSSYSADVKTVGGGQSIRSLGFDGKTVIRPDDGEFYACGVLSLHADSLASQLGIQEGDIIVFYYGNLRLGCEDIDSRSKNLYFSKQPSKIQIVNSQGLIDLPITTEQFLLANENLSKPLSKAPKNSIPWYSKDKREGNVKMVPNTSPECEGIQITSAGLELFNRALPYIYVAMVNKSGKRRKITLDIQWRSQGETYLGKNDNSFNREFGPELLRPTEEGMEIKFDVTPGSVPGLTMQEVALVECR